MTEDGALAPRTERENPFESFAAAAARASEAGRREILVAISNPETVGKLISLATSLCRSGDVVVALKVVPVAQTTSLEAAQHQAILARRFRDLMQLAVKHGSQAGTEVEPVLQVAHDVAAGIVEVANSRPDTRLLLMGWPGSTRRNPAGADICRSVMREAHCDVAVFLNRGLDGVRRILVPVSGGPHARLGLRLAAGLVEDQDAEVIALRVVSEKATDLTPERASVERLARDETRNKNSNLAIVSRVSRSASVVKGILDEIDLGCDLLIIGASEEGRLRHWLFGSIPAALADSTPCSMLLVQKGEISPASWLRRLARRLLGTRLRPRQDGA